MRRRDVVGSGLAFAALAALGRPRPAQAKPFVDSAGRQVEVAEPVAHVFPAGPPASLTLFMLAPEKMLGWTRAPSPAAKAFLPPRFAELPEIGRLTGGGHTVALDALARLAPDLVLDVGSTGQPYVALADKVQAEAHVPYAVIGGRLSDTPATLRTIGSLLGVAERGETLARYAKATLAETRQRVAAVPVAQRPSVYVARGSGGLETATAGSILSETVDLLGARNVVAREVSPRSEVAVAPEQIAAWQPDIVLVGDRGFYAKIRSDPLWRDLKAVQSGRVHFIPDLPFSWLDDPPAPNRLIGLKWLGPVLYPSVFADDIRAEVRRFYGLFYQREPSEEQVAGLLADPPK